MSGTLQTVNGFHVLNANKRANMFLTLYLGLPQNYCGIHKYGHFFVEYYAIERVFLPQ
uniref:Uncharacterized protein n=1 Tax=Anguilla anguilla TaxID=7936 RepID=A0A0E9SEP2_ANGAN